MKKFVFTVMMLLPMLGMAQSTWELPKSQHAETTRNDNDASKKEKKAKILKDKNGKTYTIKEEDRPYLKGAVPEVDGKVAFQFSIDMPGKSASAIYDIVYDRLEKFTHTDKHTEASRIAIINKDEHSIVATCKEWIVFTDKLLILDRTKFNYVIVANCNDGSADFSIERITYEYTVQNNTEFARAEDLITDAKTLTNDGTKLKKTNSKFRKKTIDRMNEIIQYFNDTIH